MSAIFPTSDSTFANLLKPSAKITPVKGLVRVAAAQVQERHAGTGICMNLVDRTLDGHGLTDMRLCIGWRDGFRRNRRRPEDETKSKN